MSYAIAAAGTGGHVFPALAVAEALLDRGVARSEIVFFGGDRLEATVYPSAGFPFVSLELQSLRRSLSLRNLALPLVVARAAGKAKAELLDRSVRVVLGMGSYVTVPVGWAARRAGIPLFLHEQNAEAGLANRVMSKLAENTFVSFADTRGIGRQRLVGNPIRSNLAGFVSATDCHPVRWSSASLVAASARALSTRRSGLLPSDGRDHPSKSSTWRDGPMRPTCAHFPGAPLYRGTSSDLKKTCSFSMQRVTW